MEKQYLLFLDNISRTILATFVSNTENHIVVANPVVVQVVSDQQNKMKIQLVPLIFRDLQKDPSEDIHWTFNRNQITTTNNVALVDRFIAQYEFITTLTPDKAVQLSEERKTTTATTTPAPVIKLFDEEKS